MCDGQQIFERERELWHRREARLDADDLRRPRDGWPDRVKFCCH
jgi:hypothetical protein